MLERHGAEKPDIESILKHLVKEGYVDEGRYARALVHDKVRFAKWGRVKIAQALWQKRQTKGTTEYERKMKTMKSVCSRGYEPALVRKVLNLQDSSDD